MRGLGSRLPATSTTAATKQCIPFSTFSGSGGGEQAGRGRGRGRGTTTPNDGGPRPPSHTSRIIGESNPPDSGDVPVGKGHGRGAGAGLGGAQRPLPSFSSWVSDVVIPSAGRGRPQTAPPSQQPPVIPSAPKPGTPIFISGKEGTPVPPPPPIPPPPRIFPRGAMLPPAISNELHGIGRGQTIRPPQATGPEQENRHLRRQDPEASPVQRGRAPIGSWQRGRGRRGGETEMGASARRMRGRGGRQGMRGGRQSADRGRGRFRRRGRGDEDDDSQWREMEEDDGTAGQLATRRLGEEKMNMIMGAFENVVSRALPSAEDDAYLDALDLNYKFEFDEEYLMEQFGRNPDIEEKPAMSLEEMLEKCKPFLMAYEGIQNQEEWKEIIKETMEKVPHMEELINMYGGPERVTAKQQSEELQSLASKIPDNVPPSLRSFTDRAVLSFQSNPGWGFDKKYQFMGKLVWQVNKLYKSGGGGSSSTQSKHVR